MNMIINKKLLSPVLPESMEDIVTDSVYLLNKQENEEEVRDIVLKNIVLEGEDLPECVFQR